jgi:hypothetical protein
MLPFGVTIPATVPQRSEFPEGLMNYHIFSAALKERKSRTEIDQFPVLRGRCLLKMQRISFNCFCYAVLL